MHICTRQSYANQRAARAMVNAPGQRTTYMTPYYTLYGIPGDALDHERSLGLSTSTVESHPRRLSSPPDKQAWLLAQLTEAHVRARLRIPNQRAAVLDCAVGALPHAGPAARRPTAVHANVACWL